MRNKENNYKSKYYTNKQVRSKIDKLLHEHAAEQATLGTDSKQKEIRKVVKKQLEIEAKIKEIDPEFWESTFKIERDEK